MPACGKFGCFYKRISVLSILVILVFSSNAQFIFKPKKPIRTEQVWPDKDERTELADSLPFSTIRIVDSRYDTSGIGFDFSHYLMLREACPAVAWKQIIKGYYQSLCSKGKDTLVIQLEKFGIQEDLIMDTHCISNAGYIRANFFKGKQDSFVYLGMMDSLIQEKYTPRRFENHKHGKHINFEWWDYYLLRLLDLAMVKATYLADTVTAFGKPSCTLDGIIKSGWIKRDKPILKSDSLQHGFYRDFAEFVNNNPTFGYVNEESLKKLLVIMHYRVDKNLSTEVPDTSYWGYCDGKNIFIRHAYDFFQLERKDCVFYLSPTLDANRIDGNRSAWNMLIGLGTLAGSVAAGSGPELGGFDALHAKEFPMVLIDSRSIPIVSLQLDWDTGELTY